MCKNVHQPKNCVTEQFIDPVKAWKIAGLPNPGEEVIMFKAWAARVLAVGRAVWCFTIITYCRSTQCTMHRSNNVPVAFLLAGHFVEMT
jgi:hypothetical protein